MDNPLSNSLTYINPILEERGLKLSPIFYPFELFCLPAHKIMRGDKVIATINWKTNTSLLDCFPKNWNLIMDEGNKIHRKRHESNYSWK